MRMAATGDLREALRLLRSCVNSVDDGFVWYYQEICSRRSSSADILYTVSAGIITDILPHTRDLLLVIYFRINHPSIQFARWEHMQRDTSLVFLHLLILVEHLLHLL